MIESGLEVLLIIPITLTMIKLIVGPTSWDRLLAYASFSTKIIILMIFYTFISEQLILLDMIIVVLILNIWGILITTRFLKKGGFKR